MGYRADDPKRAGPATLGLACCTRCPTPLPTHCSPWRHAVPRPKEWCRAFARLGDELPDQLDSMLDAVSRTSMPRAFVAVVAASDSLGPFCITERRAHEVLGDLDRQVSLNWVRRAARWLSWHRLEILPRSPRATCSGVTRSTR